MPVSRRPYRQPAGEVGCLQREGVCAADRKIARKRADRVEAVAGIGQRHVRAIRRAIAGDQRQIAANGDGLAVGLCQRLSRRIGVVGVDPDGEVFGDVDLTQHETGLILDGRIGRGDADGALQIYFLRAAAGQRAGDDDIAIGRGEGGRAADSHQLVKCLQYYNLIVRTARACHGEGRRLGPREVELGIRALLDIACQRGDGEAVAGVDMAKIDIARRNGDVAVEGHPLKDQLIGGGAGDGVEIGRHAIGKGVHSDECEGLEGGRNLKRRARIAIGQRGRDVARHRQRIDREIIDRDDAAGRSRRAIRGSAAAQGDGAACKIIRIDRAVQRDPDQRAVSGVHTQALDRQVARLRGQNAARIRDAVDDQKRPGVVDRHRLAKESHAVGQRIAVADRIGVVAVKGVQRVGQRDVEKGAGAVGRLKRRIAGDGERIAHLLRDRAAARDDDQLARIGRLGPAIDIDRIVRRAAIGRNGPEDDPVSVDQRNVLTGRVHRAAEIVAVRCGVIVERDVEIAARGQGGGARDRDRCASAVGDRAGRRHRQRSAGGDFTQNDVVRIGEGDRDAIRRHGLTEIVGRIVQRDVAQRRQGRGSGDIDVAAGGGRSAVTDGAAGGDGQCRGVQIAKLQRIEIIDRNVRAVGIHRAREIVRGVRQRDGRRGGECRLRRRIDILAHRAVAILADRAGNGVHDQRCARVDIAQNDAVGVAQRDRRSVRRDRAAKVVRRVVQRDGGRRGQHGRAGDIDVFTRQPGGAVVDASRCHAQRRRVDIRQFNGVEIIQRDIRPGRVHRAREIVRGVRQRDGRRGGECRLRRRIDILAHRAVAILADRAGNGVHDQRCARVDIAQNDAVGVAQRDRRSVRRDRAAKVVRRVVQRDGGRRGQHGRAGDIDVVARQPGSAVIDASRRHAQRPRVDIRQFNGVEIVQRHRRAIGVHHAEIVGGVVQRDIAHARRQRRGSGHVDIGAGRRRRPVIDGVRRDGQVRRVDIRQLYPIEIVQRNVRAVRRHAADEIV